MIRIIEQTHVAGKHSTLQNIMLNWYMTITTNDEYMIQLKTAFANCITKSGYKG